ncbi:MAG: TonB family protein [Bacteroidota bacterium]
MKPLKYALCLIVLLTSVAMAQEEPKSDEFVLADAEPKPLNMEEVRQAIGYPRAAVDGAIEGQVVARVLVNKQGNYVKHKLIQEGHPILAKAVEAQVSRLKFSPAVLEGAVIPFWVNIPFRFKLVEAKNPLQLAVDSIGREIRTTPEVYALYVDRALLYLSLERYDSAMSDVTQSIELNPKKNKKKGKDYAYWFAAEFVKGRTLAAQEQWEAARRSLDEALAIAEKAKNQDSLITTALQAVYLQRGSTWAIEELYENALQDYDQALSYSGPNNCIIHSLKYDAHLKLEQYEEVVQDLDSIIVCQPEEVAQYYNRAYYKAKSGDHAGAVVDFDTLISRTDNFLLKLSAHNQKARAFMDMEKLDEAIDSIDAALLMNALNPQSYYYRALIYLKKEDYVAACKDLGRAVDFGLSGDELTEVTQLVAENCEKK